MWPEREKITQATWTSPVTNRVLFEAGFSSFSSKWGGYVPPGSQTGLVAVTEQSTAAGVPVPELHLPRLELGRVQQSAAQHLAGVARLRDRRAQLQSRLPGGVRGVPAGPERRQPAGLHVQQRDAHAVHDAHRPAHPEQPHALRRLLRPGSVDARPSHAAGRRCATSTRGAGSPRARTASPPTTGSAAASSSRGRMASPASTTSRRAWARRTICSGTARRR